MDFREWQYQNYQESLDGEDYCKEEKDICNYCGNEFPESEIMIHEGEKACIDCYNDLTRTDY